MDFSELHAVTKGCDKGFFKPCSKNTAVTFQGVSEIISDFRVGFEDHEKQGEIQLYSRHINWPWRTKDKIQEK